MLVKISETEEIDYEKETPSGVMIYPLSGRPYRLERKITDKIFREEYYKILNVKESEATEQFLSLAFNRLVYVSGYKDDYHDKRVEGIDYHMAALHAIHQICGIEQRSYDRAYTNDRRDCPAYRYIKDKEEESA